MGYLDYPGLSRFLSKLKTIFISKNTDASKNTKYLKGDGTYDSPAMSELGLNVVDGKIVVTYQVEESGT